MTTTFVFVLWADSSASWRWCQPGGGMANRV